MMIKVGLAKYRNPNHANPRPRWTTLDWLTETECVSRLKSLDALADEKDCLRLLKAVFDDQTSESIISGQW